MKLSNIILLIFGVFFVIGIVHLQNKKTRKISTDHLRIGTAAGYAPFVSINEKGEYEGFDIDIAYELGKTLGKKIELIDLGSMTSLFAALDQGKIDAIIWGLSITPERLKKVCMIPYQGKPTYEYPLLFWEKIPLEIATLEDMKGKKISVESGSSQDAFLSKFPLVNKVVVEKVDDAFLNIQYKKADAALVEPAIAEKFKHKCPAIQILSLPLPLQDQVLGVGIALAKKNEDLIKTFQQGINIMQEKGVISALEEKWGLG